MAGPVEQHHNAPKVEEEKKGNSQTRRERRKNKKVEGAKGSSLSQPLALERPAIHPAAPIPHIRPPTPTTIVDSLASNTNNPPIFA